MAAFHWLVMKHRLCSAALNVIDSEVISEHQLKDEKKNALAIFCMCFPFINRYSSLIDSMFDYGLNKAVH